MNDQTTQHHRQAVPLAQQQQQQEQRKQAATKTKNDGTDTHTKADTKVPALESLLWSGRSSPFDAFTRSIRDNNNNNDDEDVTSTTISRFAKSSNLPFNDVNDDDPEDDDNETNFYDDDFINLKMPWNNGGGPLGPTPIADGGVEVVDKISLSDFLSTRQEETDFLEVFRPLLTTVKGTGTDSSTSSRRSDEQQQQQQLRQQQQQKQLPNAEESSQQQKQLQRRASLQPENDVDLIMEGFLSPRCNSAASSEDNDSGKRITMLSNILQEPFSMNAGQSSSSNSSSRAATVADNDADIAIIAAATTTALAPVENPSQAVVAAVAAAAALPPVESATTVDSYTTLHFNHSFSYINPDETTISNQSHKNNETTTSTTTTSTTHAMGDEHHQDDEDDDEDDDHHLHVGGGSVGGVGGGPSLPSSQKLQWNQRFEELCHYKQRHGHVCVPSNYDENPCLAQWVRRQRHQKKRKVDGKHSNLSDDREALLTNLGFVWNAHHASWEGYFSELLKFRAKHGHCLVPTRYAENPGLAVWVKLQRRQFRTLKKEKKTQEEIPEVVLDRMTRLHSVDFVWNPRNLNH